jgi:uncharacterized protein
MNSFAAYILTAFSLVLVIEGLVYALFPDALRRLMALALTLPANQMRLFGLVMTATGFGLAWIFSRF